MFDAQLQSVAPSDTRLAAPVSSVYQNTYDAIIVGARMAGATTAALLAQQGANVLLLERASFPAPTVSCPVFFGNSLAVLKRIGALDAVEAIGAPRIHYYGGRTPTADLLGRLPPSCGYDYAYSIRREILDTTVLRHIETHNTLTVREGFHVTDLVWGNGQVVGIRGHMRGHKTETFYARGVIGADGKRSLVARLVQATTYSRLDTGTCLFYAYYRDFEPLSAPSCVVYGNPHAKISVLVMDADSGLTAVSVGFPAEQFAEIRKNPEQAIERAMQSIPEVAKRARFATRASAVVGQAPTASFYRQSYGPGWALVGDAGHYIDPITGQGINNALQGAELLAYAWARTQKRSSWMQAMADYQRQRDELTRPMYDLIGMSKRFVMAANFGIDINKMIFQAIARRPDLATLHTGIFNGATPVWDFYNPWNLTRVLVEDTLQYTMPQLIANAVSRAVLPYVPQLPASS